MKKLFNDNIRMLPALLINTIIVGGITAYATSAAKDISFKSNNPTFMANNVEDAMNELYNFAITENSVAGDILNGKLH